MLRRNRFLVAPSIQEGKRKKSTQVLQEERVFKQRDRQKESEAVEREREKRERDCKRSGGSSLATAGERAVCRSVTRTKCY